MEINNPFDVFSEKVDAESRKETIKYITDRLTEINKRLIEINNKLLGGTKKYGMQKGE